MRLRRLQQRDEFEGWYDDAYVYENEDGRLVFCYNLTWGASERGIIRNLQKQVSLEAG
ncbi:MAG: hypothetical protein HS126_37765 [Anaerolineales bacterium]|nr:hypothetical protein [Anaerolineales bacterium]